ncbi:MAG TPA: hypothetical protein VJ499_05365 [Flavisolibacter sp.]|nr:hypothetical protein [Flavisolibacter sp.]
MKTQASILSMGSYIAWVIVAAIGILNLFLVHPVPGIVFLTLSMLYFPPSSRFFQRLIGTAIPLGVKIILFVIILWFTLGVSDLGDMID